MAMTAKMVKFCQEYCIDLNATQAAIRAGYSEDTARNIASENLTKPDIQNYIAELQAESLMAAKVTRDRVVNEFAKIAFSDIRKIFNEHGALKSVHEIDSDTAAAIAGFEVDELWIEREQAGTTKKIKLSSKQAALESLAKIGGWNAPDKIAQTDVNGNDIERLIDRLSIEDLQLISNLQDKLNAISHK